MILFSTKSSGAILILALSAKMNFPQRRANSRLTSGTFRPAQRALAQAEVSNLRANRKLVSQIEDAGRRETIQELVTNREKTMGIARNMLKRDSALDGDGVTFSDELKKIRYEDVPAWLQETCAKPSRAIARYKQMLIHRRKEKEGVRKCDDDRKNPKKRTLINGLFEYDAQLKERESDLRGEFRETKFKDGKAVVIDGAHAYRDRKYLKSIEQDRVTKRMKRACSSPDDLEHGGKAASSSNN